MMRIHRLLILIIVLTTVTSPLRSIGAIIQNGENPDSIIHKAKAIIKDEEEKIEEKIAEEHEKSEAKRS